MSGSHVSLIVMPIVIALALAFWISLVYYASFHPRWKHHGRAPKTEVAGGAFEATHGGRQLEPLWGEPVEGIPRPRGAAAGAESYQAADAQAREEADAGARASTSAGATASGPRQPE